MSFDGRLHERARHPLGALDDGVGRDAQRHAADHGAARRERAAAERDLRGIALDVVDGLERHAEPFRHELRERGLVTLSVRMRAGDDRDHAARIEAQLHALVEHAAELDIGRDRASAQLAVPPARGAPGLELRPLGNVEALVHHSLEFAAVVIVMGRRVIGQRRRRDEIAAADLDPVDPGHLRGAVDQALDQVDRLGPPGAAIDRGRRGVGEDRLRAELDRLHVVDARNEHEREEQRRRDGGPPIGAERLVGLGAQPKELAVAVERELAVHDLIARLGIEQQPLAARRRPFHRPAQPARCPQHQHIVGIDVGLHAEAAADVWRHDADLRFGNVENCRRELAAEPVRILRRRVERVTTAAVRRRSRSAARSRWR